MLFFIYQTTQNIIASPVTGIPNHRKSASNRAGSIIYNRFVYGKSVRTEVFHYLLVKEHGKYAHSHIYKEGGKSRCLAYTSNKKAG